MELGKAYEAKLKEDFMKIPGITIDRLYDTTNGFKSITNVCDFIIYRFPFIVYAECKTIKGNTFPLSNLKQYDKLIVKKDIKGVIAGVFLWFHEHDNCIVFVPITTFEKLKQTDKKSFNVKMIGGEDYPSIRIPSVKKRTFYDSDYSVIFSDVG